MSNNETEEEKSSFVSRILFNYINDFIYKANIKEMEYDDLCKFDKYQKNLYSKIQPDFTLWSTLFYLYFSHYPWLLIYSAIYVACLFIPSIIIRNLISNLQNETNYSLMTGILYSCLILLVSIMWSVVSYQRALISLKTSLMIEGDLQTSIFNKFVYLKTHTRYSSSEISQLIAIDSIKVSDFISKLHLIIEAPIVVLITFTLLYLFYGATTFIGMIVLLVLPVSVYISRTAQKNNEITAKFRSQRVKILTETFSNMKLVKELSIEKKLTEKLKEIRKNELESLQYSSVLLSFNGVSLKVFLLIANTLTLLLYVYIYQVLDISIIFTTLNYFNILERPLLALMDSSVTVVDAVISSKKIETFLTHKSKELPNKDLDDDDDEDKYAIIMENASFSWKDKNDLDNINLKIKKNTFNCVIGTIGCGKSTLLQAICNYVPRTEGRMKINGTIAYCPKTPWIIQSTIRENILFEKPFDKERYENILEVCDLNEDIEKLKDGDLEEISEHSENITEWIKQKISLARACYSDKDIILLDSVLSSQENWISGIIFTNLKDYLSKKTILLIAQDPDIFKQADHVIMLEKGRVIKYEKEEVPSSPIFGNDLLTPGWIETQTEFEEEKKPKPKHHKHHEPKTTHGSLNNISLNDYLYYFSHYGSYFFISIICMILLSSFRVVISTWLSYWSSDAFGFTTNTYILIYLFLALLQICFTIFQKITFIKGGIKTGKKIHSKMVNSLMKTPITYFDHRSTKTIMQKFTEDQAKIDGPLHNEFSMFFICTLLALIVIITIIIVSPISLIAISVVVIIFIFIPRIMREPFFQIRRFVAFSKGLISQNFSNTFSGILVIRTFGLQNKICKEFDEKIDYHHKSRFMDFLLNSWVGIRLELGCALVIFTTALVSSIQKSDAAMTALTITYALSISEALSWAVKFYVLSELGLLNIQRMKDTANLPHEENMTSEISSKWPSQGKIEFKDATFTLYPEKSSFENVNIKIEPKSTIGIVGDDSYLISLIYKLYDLEKGIILIDDVDLKDIGLQHIRRKISILPKDPIIFTGTIRFNLDPFSEYSDAQIWDAIEQVNMKKKFLLKGITLETSDYAFSIGEKQLVYFAKTFLNSNNIIIFDHVHVDKNMNITIKNLLKKLKNQTVIIISNKSDPILQICQRVINFKDGKVEEYDDIHKLLKLERTISSKFF